MDEYIAQYSPEIQKKLNELRKVIHESAPEATEKISWQMPTFYLHGNLIHFAVQKAHIGLYPGPSGIERFTEELAEYKTSKGAAQFPFSKPIPFGLIRKIIAFRVAENKQWADEKVKKQPAGNDTTP